MNKPFSPQRLANIRRIRKARRLFKKTPLFAFVEMAEEIPGYTYTQFLDDLRIRRRKTAKRKIVSNLKRYGRYSEMLRLIQLYNNTGDSSYGLSAMKLRKEMTRPYRIAIQKNRQFREYYLSPLIPYQTIVVLVKEMSVCNDLAAAERHFMAFKNQSHIL